jgi:uncharacterized protein YkwD
MTVAIRRRSFRTIALTTLCLVGVITAATGCNARELSGRSQGLINNERTKRGLAELAWDQNAADKAQAWAEKLAASRSLSHSRLTDGIAGDWTVLGENVGFARSVDDTHVGFMKSPKHREAILSGAYRSVGVGVATNGGLVYVVQVFRG